ncbi:hypothetical protein GOV09_00855 [Candidatus Woesearchaeota archaeon]|nr:hypothetical protein [Candidatus Woesearchaeota archaeon]
MRAYLSLFCLLLLGCADSGYRDTEVQCSFDTDCARSGCSGQLCVQAVDADDIITTCEWKEEYACYQLTDCICDLGHCVWEETDEFESCLEEAK